VKHFDIELESGLTMRVRSSGDEVVIQIPEANLNLLDMHTDSSAMTSEMVLDVSPLERDWENNGKAMKHE
jgi:hypothetical protein